MNTVRQPLNSLYVALLCKCFSALQMGLHSLIPFPKGKYLWEETDTFTTPQAKSNTLLVCEKEENSTPANLRKGL